MKKVAILGYAPSWSKAPFDNDEFELWGINDLHVLIPKAKNITRWFDIHSHKQLEMMPIRGIEEGSEASKGKYLANLASLPYPVYMQEHFEDVPNSVKYPIEHIVQKFGRYFTNSISYLLAMAIDEGYTEIHLYGVEMAQDSEYAYQRPSVEFFMGIARGLGITIHLPEGCTLLQTAWLYGYDDEPQQITKEIYRKRAIELNSMLQTNDMKKRDFLNHNGQAALVNENYFLLGALEDTNFYLKQTT